MPKLDFILGEHKGRMVGFRSLIVYLMIRGYEDLAREIENSGSEVFNGMSYYQRKVTKNIK